MKKLLMAVLILIVLLFFLGLYYWAVYIKLWPWWFGATLIAGIIGSGVTGLFIRKVILRARERKFVKRILDQDDAAIKTAPVAARYQLQELQERWRKSIEELRKSHLRKQGNPLYVLPWFLILGESGSGKTTAIQNSKLSSPLTDVSKAAGISGTRNCDWWFFNEAIVLDTAGRYAVPVDEIRDKEEWLEFLTLLTKFRKKEPLSGVIITVAAEKLTPEFHASLKEDGQFIRKRIDHLMHSIGAKFPVYVLVTKMDKVLGFVDLFDQLPKDRTSQAMGHINTRKFASWSEIIDDVEEDISEKLRELRLLLIHEDIPGEPSALMFPHEFDRLFEPLRTFLKDVFEENPYQETPYLRGIFFSSARRDGRPRPDFPNVVPVVEKNDIEKSPEDEFFLKDFFVKILPGDRGIFKPLRELLIWKQLTNRLGVVSLILVTMTLIGIFAFSFYQNVRTIRGFTAEFYQPPELAQKSSAADILTLEKLRTELRDLEAMNRSWWMPHFIYSQSNRVEELVKKHYEKLVQDTFLSHYDDMITSSTLESGKKITDEEIAADVDYSLYRIYLLKQYSEWDGKAVPDQFRKVSARMLMARDPELNEEIASRFGEVYLTYLSLAHPDGDTQAEQNEFYLKIYEILNKEGQGLRWFVRNWTLSSWNDYAPNIKITDFCGDLIVVSKRDIIAVSGAYTEAGANLIRNFKNTVEAATPGQVIDKDFWPWYYQRFYNQWFQFSRYMGGWLAGLDEKTDWEYMASLMTTDHNPFFQLIQKMSEEFGAVPPGITSPAWASLVVRLDEIRMLAEVEKEKQEGSFTAKIAGTKETLLRKTLETVDAEKAKRMALNLDLAKNWHDYLLALKTLEDSLISQEMSYKLVRGYFSPEENSENSLEDLYTVHVRYTKFLQMMKEEGDVSLGLGLVRGPLDFLVSYTTEKTACVLQKRWDNEVLAEVQGVDSAQVPKILFNQQDGVVWKFVDGAAKPFIDKGKKGFYNRRVRNAEIDFSTPFFTYLNRGREGSIATKPEYAVTMEALPIEINQGAQIEPFSSVIQLSCAQEKQFLENYNSPVSRNFKWSPDSCGTTLIAIWFPDITLTKEYSGDLAFARFLADFKDGNKTFVPDDFPEAADLLRQRNISELRLSYNIIGGNEIIKLLNKVPDYALQNIAECR